MRCMLTYTGSLPPNGNSQQKHQIRRALLPQLKTQWEIEPVLHSMTQAPSHGTAKIDQIADRFSLGRFRFVPLVTREFGLVCFLQITLLRPGEPGAVIRPGGDIDNRLKTLFDSLSVPSHSNQVTGIAPQSHENPFYCLLEDDSLITGFEIRTERLLEPLTNPTDVRLMIAATIRPTKVTIQNLAFLGGWLS